MSILSEFRDFAVKGNVIDLAVGVLIGAAFGKIVTSLTDDIISPVLGVFTKGTKALDGAFITLSTTQYNTIKEATDAGVGVLKYGAFLTAVINFMITAFIIFLLVKGINRLRTQWATVAPPPSAPPPQEVLLTEIRDLMKTQQSLPK